MKDHFVFINCPFSDDYRIFFQAIVFAVVRCGFAPRCARENDDGGEVRFDKICRIIDDCRYGIHDISKTEPDGASSLPRFNMPLELGLFLGARRYGGAVQKRKKSLILDRAQHRYQQFISDIAGQDVHSHDGVPERLIEVVVRWLHDEVRDRHLPGGRAIAAEFARFQAELPALARQIRHEVDELTFLKLQTITAGWVSANADA